MIYFIAHTFKCVCHCRRAMFRVLGMYNFALLFFFKVDCILPVYFSIPVYWIWWKIPAYPLINAYLSNVYQRGKCTLKHNQSENNSDIKSPLKVQNVYAETSFSILVREDSHMTSDF